MLSFSTRKSVISLAHAPLLNVFEMVSFSRQMEKAHRNDLFLYNMIKHTFYNLKHITLYVFSNESNKNIVLYINLAFCFERLGARAHNSKRILSKSNSGTKRKPQTYTYTKQFKSKKTREMK